jgi:hypothetical protein
VRTTKAFPYCGDMNNIITSRKIIRNGKYEKEVSKNGVVPSNAVVFL